MKILITGATGQLGWELQRTAPVEHEVLALARHQLDLSKSDEIARKIDQIKPEVIINAAAFTAVDNAEQQCDLAFQINATAPEIIAKAAAKVGARLIHISTDYVFDGEQSHPYAPEDVPNPINVYGASKRAGEIAIRGVPQLESTILRTSWVYSAHGNNFVKTMLRLMTQKPQLGIVADQIGTPTWGRNLAETVWEFVTNSAACGIYHYTDAGVASWYDFALAIQEEGLRLGLLNSAIPIMPITTLEYPLPATRPFYSVLDKQATWVLMGEFPQHWRAALKSMCAELVT